MSERSTPKNNRSVRLPDHFRPERYRIILKPDLDTFIFEGEETIRFTLRKPVREIVLHSKDLEISKVRFRKGRKEVFAEKIRYDADAETAAFVFPSRLPRGKAELELEFRGKLSEQMRGFYRSRYLVGGREKFLATTQFEATDARRAFPCFDEPAMKAVFDVTLMVRKGLTAISNTLPAAVREHEPGYQTVRFEPSPKMSTYLLAFIVGDLEFVEGKTKEGILVRVFTTPGKKEQARFALEVAKRCLSFYSRYFGIPYPLPVLDLIAIPDFEAAAMENWGAVTYRESALLVDPEHSSERTRQWVAVVIAHELAHQWFGNLTTMEWWTHLWLNEGFARYMEYLTLDALYPEWKMWDRFAAGVLGSAMELDALEHTHPIEVEVHHPREIAEIFDEVSYSKGAAVIKMLADHLGPRDFRDGLRHYLKKHSYANASTEDLWLAFEHVSRKPVREMMKTWTRKPGYPLVRIAERKGDLFLRQSRFFASPLSRKASRDATVWNVPLRAAYGKRIKDGVLDRRTVSLPKPAGKGWLKLNAGGFGFYRTDYPADFLRRLRAPVADKELGPADRLNLLRDAFALAESGDLPTREALIFAEAYRGEEEYAVLGELVLRLAQTEILLGSEDFLDDYREFARSLLSDAVGRAGWMPKKGEKALSKLTRTMLLAEAVRYGEDEALRTARKMWRGKRVPPDLRSVVYRAAAQYGGLREHRELVRRYRESELQEEKDRLGGALAAFRRPELLRKSLGFFLSDAVRAQDAPYLLAAAWRNPAGVRLTWEFIKKNWREFERRYTDGHLLARMMEAAGYMTRSKDARDLRNFFKKHPLPAARRTLAQAEEEIRSRAAWLRRDGAVLKRWLRGRK